MIDTHSHIYDEVYDSDRRQVVQRAMDVGVRHVLLANVDVESMPKIFAMKSEYSDFCSVALGLHPTSVDECFEENLSKIQAEAESAELCAIGEIGIDLYWSQQYEKQQIEAFETQIQWAKELKLPILIHSRDAFIQTYNSIKKYNDTALSGVFHCFSGNEDEAKAVIELKKFKLGINGAITFKNNKMPTWLGNIPIKHLILETDAPYLSPEPYRGKRNEPANLPLIVQKIAFIYRISTEEVCRITTENAIALFPNMQIKC